MNKNILTHITVLSLLLLLPVIFTYANPPAFPTENKIIFDAALSKHGQVLFVADGTDIKAFSFDDRNLIREFSNEHTSQIMSLSVSADSTLMASGDRDGKLVLHCMKSGRSLHTFTVHEGIIMGTDISPDSKFLASASTDNNIVLYDLSKMEVIEVFRVHADHVMSVTFSPDGRWLISAGADGKIAVIDMKTKKPRRVMEDLNFFIRDVAFLHHGQSFITVGDDGRYYTWRITGMGNVQMARSPRVMRHWITSINHSTMDPVFVIANTRGRIIVMAQFSQMITNIRVPVNTILLRPREDRKIEVIAATRGRGIVFIDASDMKIRSF
ncbi:MAG: hypothetical protein EA393_12235 [Bacteroidetes bacterium]|nr:MAG: hypothetical protein EA393_12235 [Bacteroidota bacterium]